MRRKRAPNEFNEYISSLNVADLRSVLHSHGLVIYGSKKDLQERLVKALQGRKTADDNEVVKRQLIESNGDDKEVKKLKLTKILAEDPSTKENSRPLVEAMQGQKTADDNEVVKISGAFSSLWNLARLVAVRLLSLVLFGVLLWVSQLL